MKYASLCTSLILLLNNKKAGISKGYMILSECRVSFLIFSLTSISKRPKALTPVNLLGDEGVAPQTLSVLEYSTIDFSPVANNKLENLSKFCMSFTSRHHLITLNLILSQSCLEYEL